VILRTARASAPVRLDFAGGWTDVEPYASERGGVVVNAAIERRAFVDVQPAERYLLRSDDLDLTLMPRIPADFEKSGQLDLLKAAVRMSGVGPCRIRTSSQAPPGSGLGSSGAMDVALIAALEAATARPAASASQLAERAWHLEAVEAALPGGLQDQYAAALGGFNRLTFRGGAVEVTPLALEAAFRAALEERVLVCYTGQSRVSGDTIARVMTAFVRGDPKVTRALDGLVEAGVHMTEALLDGDLSGVGKWLSANWRHQQALDPGMRTDLMARLEAAMLEVGVLGGKAAGAGAGGSMFFLLDGPRARAEEAARAAGATVLPFTWADCGVRIW